MEAETVRRLLDEVAGGAVSPELAAARLAAGPLRPDGTGVADLGFARLDTHRPLRTGEPEVVLAAGKTAEQVVTLVAALAAAGQPALVTRAAAEVLDAVLAAHPEARVDTTARCALVGSPAVATGGRVAVVSGGTSDAPVVAEAAFTAAALGVEVDALCDVGVAGVHRLLAVRDRLVRADCLVVVAGMEGALPSVVGGLVDVPVIAVPTSVGYGVSAGGWAALHTMLASCAPGIAVCNIDNGFGAAVVAARVARAVGRARRAATPAGST